MEFLVAPENAPFLLALLVMLGMALLEGVGALVGGSLSQLVDGVLPDLDADLDLEADLDADTELDAPPPGAITRGLGWLHFGRVPALVVMVLFLTGFGLLGLGLQGLVYAVSGALLPSWLAVPAALLPTLPAVRISGGWVARLIPKDQSSAVSSDSFVGRVATVVLGTARPGAPTQARLRDAHGRSHYVLVEPDSPGDELPHDSQVLLVRRDGARFRAVRAPSALLADSAKAS